MAKKAYIGVSNVARRVRKMYIGVGGVARKVRKGYIGIAGIARLFFSGGNIEYYSSISTGRSSDFNVIANASNEHYTGWLGGNQSYSANKGIFFDSSLTQHQAHQTTSQYAENAGCGIEDYLLFGGGYTERAPYTVSPTLYYFDSSLTSGYVDRGWSYADSATVRLGDIAIFAGGEIYSSAYVSYDNYITVDNSLTIRSYSEGFPTNRSRFRAGIVGDYALFGSGRSWTSTAYISDSIPVATTDSLTFTQAEAFSANRADYNAASNGKHLLFAGGYVAYSGSESATNTVEVYDASLTKIANVSALSNAAYGPAQVELEGFAIFASTNGADIYNDELTRTFDASLKASIDSSQSSKGSWKQGGHIGDFGLVPYGTGFNVCKLV